MKLTQKFDDVKAAIKLYSTLGKSKKWGLLYH